MGQSQSGSIQPRVCQNVTNNKNLPVSHAGETRNLHAGRAVLDAATYPRAHPLSAQNAVCMPATAAWSARQPLGYHGVGAGISIGRPLASVWMLGVPMWPSLMRRIFSANPSWHAGKTSPASFRQRPTTRTFWSKTRTTRTSSSTISPQGEKPGAAVSRPLPCRPGADREAAYINTSQPPGSRPGGCSTRGHTRFSWRALGRACHIGRKWPQTWSMKTANTRSIFATTDATRVHARRLPHGKAAAASLFAQVLFD